MPEQPISLRPSKVGRCAALTMGGRPCMATRQRESDFCFHHDPARARERAEARKRGGRNRLGAHDSRGARESVEIRSVRDVLGILEEAISDTLAEAPSQARARTLAYVALAALRTLEVGELESRIAALEARADAQPHHLRRIQ